MLVLVAIAIMTLTTSSYLLLMRNEHLAARYSGSHLQAQMLAESGVDYLQVFLGQTTAAIDLQGGLLNNAGQLQDVLIVDDALPNYRGRFTVLAPDIVQGYYQGLRYGLQNESAKLNLNSLLISDSSSTTVEQTFTPRDRLMVIPGMTEEIADAILDWMDENDSARSSGAEADYYLSLTNAYRPANRPLAHLDELLMVRGVTRDLLYGADVNRNFQVDSDEQLSPSVARLDNTEGQLDRGWSAYLTVLSSELGVTPEGEPKLNVNEDDLQALHGQLLEALGAAEANFIVAFRQFGPAESGTTGASASAEALQLDFEQPGETNIGSLLDLVDAKVTTTDKNGGQPKTIDSPWTSDGGTFRLGFAELLDVATSDTSERIAGRININLASRPVLLTIPGMTEVIADQILTSREPDVDRVGGEQRHPTWLVADELVSLEEFKPMYPFLTTGGDVYTCQVAGFFDAGTTHARLHVALDRSGERTKLLERKDLHALGPGFSRAQLSTVLQPED